MPASLNRIASAIAMDRWEEIGENTNIWNPEEEPSDIACDPLYVVCSQRKLNPDVDLQDILRSFIRDPKELENYQYQITPEDMIEAKEIRNYYRNQLMVKNLKNETLSDHLKILQTIVENDKSLNREMIPILVKLPSTYVEDLKTAEIFKLAENPPKPKKRIIIDQHLIYLGSVRREGNNQDYDSFYFLDDSKILFTTNANINSTAHAAWKFIANLKKVVVTGSGIREKRPLQTLIYYQIQPDLEILSTEPVNEQ